MNSRARFFLALWLIVASIAGSPAPCMANAPVTLHPACDVRKGVVHLSDLFTGVPDETDRAIAQAPPPGKQAVYDANLLTKLAEKYKLGWRPQSPEDHVTVTAIYSRITEDIIRKAVVQKIKDDDVRGDVDVVFDNRAIAVNLPADQAPDFVLNNFQYDALTKRFSADLAAESGQGLYTMPLAGRVIVKLRVPVLSHRLETNTVVSADDIDWVDVTEERVNESAITDAGELAGHELRHTILAGELIHNNDIMAPRLVTRGGLVTMKIETPFMTLTAQGKALQDGVRGDVVRVVNTQSNRMLEGTVDGPGTVVISTAQKVAEAQ